MCLDPVSLTIGSTFLSAIGTGVGAVGAYQSGQYNAKVQSMNASLAERRAKDAIERGAKEEQRKRLDVARLQGQQRASMAANGVDLSFGSPLDTLVDTAVLGELDALQIRRNAYNEAYDYRVDAANKRASAQMSKNQATGDLIGGFLGAGGTILGGGGKAMKQSYTSYGNPGTIGSLY